jgi:transposase
LTEEKTKGRKRHIVVAVVGNLLAVIGHAANIHDTVSGIGPALFAFERYPSIKKFCADTGYRGTFVLDADEIFGMGVDISEKIKPHQWEKLPWRWGVERTYSWFTNSRRLSKDYEIAVDSAETVIRISHRLVHRFQDTDEIQEGKSMFGKCKRGNTYAKQTRLS